MKHILLSLLLIGCFTAKGAEFIMLYNADNGFTRTFNVNGKSTPGTKVDEGYRSTRFHEFHVFQVKDENGKWRRYLVRNTKVGKNFSKSNRVVINKINDNGTLGEKVDDRKKLFEYALPFRASQGSSFRIMTLRKMNNGKWAYEVKQLTKEGKMGYSTQKGTRGDYDQFHFFRTKDQTTYLLAYKTSTGSAMTIPLTAGGKFIEAKKKYFTLTRRMTSLDTYQMGQYLYLISMDKNNGKTEIRRFGNGTFKDLRFSKDFKKGWTMAKPFYNGRSLHLMFKNELDNRVLHRKIKADGDLGEITFETKNWLRGWTEVIRFRTPHQGPHTKRNCYGPQNGTFPTPTKKASLIVFYNDDPDFVRLLQQAYVQEEEMIKGYSKSVLLTNVPYGKDLPQPDVKAAATEFNLYRYLIQLASEGYYIDVFIITHGSRYGISLQKSSNHGKNPKLNWKTDGLVTANDLTKALCPIRGYRKFPIRMVFQTNCWGSNMNIAWRDAGAKAVFGARYINYYAGTIGGFLKKWKGGSTIKASATYGKESTMKATHTFFETTSTLTRIDWGGKNCKTTKVLDHDGSCPYRYWDKVWHHHRDQYYTSWKGYTNIVESSRFFFLGNQKMTFMIKPNW
ncbi:MAG: hypothetical protein AAFY71_16225 [Bacteroidota bacterium]